MIILKAQVIMNQKGNMIGDMAQIQARIILLLHGMHGQRLKILIVLLHYPCQKKIRKGKL